MAHDKAWRNFHGHARNREGVFPKSGVLEDVSQADEGHVLCAPRKMITLFNEGRRVKMNW